MTNTSLQTLKVKNISQPDRQVWWTKALLIAMHIAGFIGLALDISRPLFELLVPFNLITTTALILYFHQQWNKYFLLFFVLVSALGYFSEVVGVATGEIFGVYEYKTTLGYKVLEVPLLIGLNWFMLVYATAYIALQLKIPTWIKPIVGALMMVLIDVFIEPVAVEHHFWVWENNVIPFQNYVAWGVIAYVFQLLFFYLPFSKKNAIASTVYYCQFAFFVAHNFLYWAKTI